MDASRKRRTRSTIKSSPQVVDVDSDTDVDEISDDSDNSTASADSIPKTRRQRTTNITGKKRLLSDNDDSDSPSSDISLHFDGPISLQNFSRLLANKHNKYDISDSDDEPFFPTTNNPEIQKQNHPSTEFSKHITSLFTKGEYTSLQLKPDHISRPLWVCADGRIIFESFSPIADQTQDFLIAVAEPISRPNFLHEYQLTEYSLYAAVSVGLETGSIIEVLDRLSKVVIPDEVTDFVKKYTLQYGKVRMVLKQNRFFVESAGKDIWPEIM
ncbi:hypothetical protein HK098_004453 [Nowakowskiella sp. JEL0407]|nr:hypothetical protein HK098_004453 [Nowakowskiella sp. JEL0407]